MGIFKLIKVILGILPFLGLCFASYKINLNKANRSRQFAMPIITFAYCTAAVFLLDYIHDLILKLINWLSGFLPFLANIPWDSIMVFVLNTILVLGFIAIKSILLPILSGIWKSDKLSEVTSGWFYEKEDDIDKWMLKKYFANLRGFYKGFYIALTIGSCLVFVLSQLYPNSVFFKAVFYPVFGILILGEVVAFLSGMTKTEFVEDILGESEESYKVANYGMLREILRDLFGERVLYENTLDTSDGISNDFEELNELAESEDPTSKTIGLYYQKLKSEGAEIDINYVKSSVNLLNGKSTLFCNPFYNDLTHYIMLPMFKQLVSYKKCLVVLGRDSALDDVKKWVNSGLSDFSGTDSLWKAEVLDEYSNSADVGIIKFSDIHNLKIHKSNREFLSKVGFVLIIEPSRILSAGQIGLSLLVNNLEQSNKDIVYCACDRNCDGLVDALSHLFKTSITEVTATIKGGANSSQMYWNADGPYMHHKLFPNISRYLGIGTEINSVAMKYQLDQTGWVGSEKFPVSDMKWIAGQYYKQICGYADLPESQASFNRAFNVYSNLWNCERKENSFLVIEDEFQNLFEITRVFASRAKNQGFVNVISENYFLRDYMLDNVAVFSDDPKAIPTIVPDFARTERNMVLKLIMMMVNDTVSEDRIAKELMLCGVPFDEPYTTLKALIVKHCHVSDPSLSVRFKEEIQNDSLHSTVVKYYEINETNELYEYAMSLKNAYYIAEDEEGESHYIGSKLYGHVFQALLPGQFITSDGKYYEVQTVTPLNGVVVRRAADHINGRKYYRQLREIRLENWVDGTEMGSKKTISDFELTRGFADISVQTGGYLEMSSYGDFAHAKKVSLNGIPERNYHNKSVLRIKLPESSARVRYTLCLLLNEIFRTTYPEAYHYINAVVPYSDELASENLKDVTYKFTGDVDNDCIYIIEDSDIDLGLIVSVERNLKRYLEIVADVLLWHNKKMSEQPEIPEETDEEFTPDFGEKPEPPKKGIKGLIAKIGNFFKKLFGKKKSKGEEPKNSEPTAENETLTAEQEVSSEEISEKEVKVGLFGKIKNFFKKLFGKKEKSEETNNEGDTDSEVVEFTEEETTVEEPDQEIEEVSKDPDEVISENENETESDETTEEQEVVLKDIAEGSPIVEETVEEITGDIGGENEEVVDGEFAPELTAYQKNCFIKFGFAEIDAIIDIEGTVEFLTKYGYDQNPLRQVREGDISIDETGNDYDPHKYGAHLCDFCGVELLGGEYELLKDGRERCNRCSMTAVKTVEDFKELYKTVLRNMEAFYGIKLNVAVKVRTTNAKQIAKHVGMQFVATPGFDGRVLGFAQKDKTGYSLYIENGSPKLAATATIAHELTHIWQYLNWNDAELTKKYGKQNMLEVYEGMAKWAEIQYLMLMNEKSYAKRQEITTRLRNDEYGKGFLLYAEKYPLSDATNVVRTPFKENPPL